VAALADRAVADASKSPEPDNAYVQFVKGLSEYRQGRDEQATIWLRKSAARLPNRPGPRLALAMAQFRSGSRQEARKTLAAAVTAYDWRDPHDDHPTVWVSHVLRREAELMVLPDLPAFLQGAYQPRDNDERLALLGICHFRRLDGVAARLYADAFAADPGLAEDLTAECFHRASREGDSQGRIEVLKTDARYLAACCAASAGCGRGEDGPKLSDADRMRWRRQSRDWLRADLTAWTKTLDGGFETAPDLARKMLTLWLAADDLAPLRDPDAIQKLPAGERADWIALWKQIGDLLASAERTNR
jgi:serine/threonine-protein kinase